jgi:L-ascorbate 6-phosphate lactonase
VKDLSKEIDATVVPSGAAALWWLGQAGFAFKTAGRSKIWLDVYLSDIVEREFGFKRMSLAPIEAWDVAADWMVSSHEHLDHLDVESLATVARRNPACRFAGPRSCPPLWRQCGIPPDRQLVIGPGETADLGGVRLRAFAADHGDLSRDALSLLFDFGDVRIFFTADTALRLDRAAEAAACRPDLVIPCINGAFGNMDAREAARLCAALSPRLAIPCHFWMFPEHGGDPAAFLKACASETPPVKARLLGPGEGLILTAEDVRPAASGR